MHNAAAPQMVSAAVPSKTMASRLFFSDFALAWTIFGNITVASGSTTHSNPRDKVPAAT